MEFGTVPELDRLEQLLSESTHPLVSVQVIHTERYQGRDYPVHAVTLGGQSGPHVPTLLLMGGVHGLERIGSDVIIAYLQTLLARLRWDEQFQFLLSRMRLVLLPMLNPVGVMLHRRANARGVDLMRNAPTESDEPGMALALHRGQRWTPRLPYYRGRGLEPELSSLSRFFCEQLFSASTLVALDVHSGFGTRDQIWFPYARSRKIFPRVAEVMGLASILEQAHPHHRYVIEPQCRHYTVHGDLWDYLYDMHAERHTDRVFVPLTLELASWGWIRKNPRQFLSRLGLFHPIKPHRVTRVLRRHSGLFDFLSRVTAAPSAWARVDPATRHVLEHEARRTWPVLA